MQELEVRFLEQYKRLEVLCNDIFSCRNGVSEYITQMEQIPFCKKRYITSWEKDYLTLKRLRWLRNKITHETSISDCEGEDIEAISAFYARILNRQDPLAMLYKIEQEQLSKEHSNRAEPQPRNNKVAEPDWSAIVQRLPERQPQYPSRTDYPERTNVPSRNKRKSGSLFRKLTFIAVAILIIVFLVYCMRM